MRAWSGERRTDRRERNERTAALKSREGLLYRCCSESSEIRESPVIAARRLGRERRSHGGSPGEIAFLQGTADEPPGAKAN